MTPEDPLDPTGVRIGDVEAQPASDLPSVQRGEQTSLAIRLQFIDDSDAETQSARYQRLKEYQEYAGEASVDRQLGGKPTLREHPQDYWPVESHVVPIVFGDEIYEVRDVWALIVSVNDGGTVIVEEPPGRTSYDTGGDYDGRPQRSPNVYRLEVGFVPLADADDYADREEALADLSPVLNQM